MKTCILGAGISGISAAYHLSLGNANYEIYEQRSTWGGLCDNFTLKGFRFDRFVHFSHTKNKYVQELFEKSSQSIRHKPICSNYYDGFWLRHPAQSYLKPLPLLKKLKIVWGFLTRSKKDISDINNYEEWLRVQYGNYFAENFPMKYTRKYWATDAKNLRTEWVGVRMYLPNITEIIKGAFFKVEKNTYYTSEMRYPVKGGYKSYLTFMANDINIHLNKKISSIDTQIKKILFEDGESVIYDRLVSSIPLPDLCSLIKNIPVEVKEASSRLTYTKGVLVSIGLKKDKLPTDLWFYIYDEDIVAARVYSPSMKSPDNAPPGHSSLQAEIYFKNCKKISKQQLEELEAKTIDSLIKMNVFNRDDLVLTHSHIESYANVVFDSDIYVNRNKIHNYLNSVDIIPIGRFGEWDYLWSDQSLESGRRAAEKILKTL